MSQDAILLSGVLKDISKDLDKATMDIAGGSCRVTNDAAATGASYLYQVGKRDGLVRADNLIRAAIAKLTRGEE